MNRPISITDLAAHGDKFANLSILRREKKKPRERIAIPAVNLQNLKLVHIVAIAKNDTANAQKEARVRGTFVSGIRKNTKFSSFDKPQKKILKEKDYNNKGHARAARHETMVLST